MLLRMVKTGSERWVSLLTVRACVVMWCGEFSTYSTTAGRQGN